MIPRVLVPINVRPPAVDPSAPAPRRLSTQLDARTLVSVDLPVKQLDARTSIPAHLPLDVLAARIVVPRDMPATPLETTTSLPDFVPLTILDSRVAVPIGLLLTPVVPKLPVSPAELPDVLDPDIITTGEVNLLVRRVDERTSTWQGIARVCSITFHGALILLLMLQPKLFPAREPTQAELELARRQLVGIVYLPPSVNDVPKLPANPTERVSPQMRIDPRVLRRVAPPTAELQPLPGPRERERVTSDLPNAPAPQLPSAPQAQPQTRGDGGREVARLERPKTPAENPAGLILPKVSPGRAIEQNLNDALRNRTGGVVIRPSGGGATGGPTGGGGQGLLEPGLQLLTPTEGVDFTNYLARVLASVKRNWYAVIPESAHLGERGKVVLQFRIMRNGSVPFAEPQLVASSGKEPLDRASMSSIHASNPFEPLPPAFSGPYIELRFIFLYNLPLDY